jgi:hypothetical protein
VAGVRVAIEGPQVWYDSSSKRIQVEIAHQLQKVSLLLHHDGAVPVLEEMAGAPVASVEGPSIPREEAPHGAGKGTGAGAHQQVHMVGEQRPGVDGQIPALGEAPEATEEVVPIPVIPEHWPPFDPPHHHMVQHSWRI